MSITAGTVFADSHLPLMSWFALGNDGSELLSRRVENEPDALRAIFSDLGGEAEVALEATFGRQWLAGLLEREGHGLRLAHPRKGIAAARVKTDAVDARTLAHLLRADLLREAYVARRRDPVEHERAQVAPHAFGAQEPGARPGSRRTGYSDPTSAPSAERRSLPQRARAGSRVRHRREYGEAAFEASWQLGMLASTRTGGAGFAREYEVERKFRETRL